MSAAIHHLAVARRPPRMPPPQERPREPEPPPQDLPREPEPLSIDWADIFAPPNEVEAAMLRALGPTREAIANLGRAKP